MNRLEEVAPDLHLGLARAADAIPTQALIRIVSYCEAAARVSSLLSEREEMQRAAELWKIARRYLTVVRDTDGDFYHLALQGVDEIGLRGDPDNISVENILERLAIEDPPLRADAGERTP